MSFSSSDEDRDMRLGTILLVHCKLEQISAVVRVAVPIGKAEIDEPFFGS